MIALLPVSTILFAEGMLNRRPAVSAGEPQEVAAALPAILMANSDSARVLFLSDRPSLLPEVWCSMPFVAGVESIWPQAERFPGRDWSKFKPHNGLPGRAVAALAGKFNLIYIDTFPSGGEAARRGFVEKLWELLEPKNGILVLPSVNRLLLPAEAQWAVLPGTRGQRVAASREAVSTDLDLLDGRLRALLEPFGEENHIPAGIFAALYYTPSPPVLPAPENDPAFAKPVSPEWFYETLFCFLLGYGAIRLYFGRYGRNPYGFALMENSAGFVLVLLAACSAMSCRELFTGVPASTIWGCVGLVFVVLPLRARAARVLALAAIVLPAVWLIPQSLIVEEPTWIIVTAIAANYMNTRGKTLNTFSFDFKDNDRYFKANAFQPERDLPYVNRMLEEYETAHSYLECDENSLIKALFAAVDAKDMPGMTDVDSSLLYFCSLVSRKNKVALTGECADEIFGGYPWFYRKELLERYGFPWSSDVAPRLALLRDDVGLELDLSGYQAFQYEESRSKAPLLYGEAGEDESRRIIGYLNIKWFMQTLLDRMDRTSMYSELEARVPFADHRIIEYVFNVPWHMKYQNGVEKTLLRDAFSDVLPPELLHRKKSPYPKTYHPGYEALLIKGMEEILDSPNAPVRTLIDTDKTREFLKAPAEYGSPWFGQLMAGPQLIAYFIQINYWMEKYQLSA